MATFAVMHEVSDLETLMIVSALAGWIDEKRCRRTCFLGKAASGTEVQPGVPERAAADSGNWWPNPVAGRGQQEAGAARLRAAQ